jgi:hypothetical protein
MLLLVQEFRGEVCGEIRLSAGLMEKKGVMLHL